MIPINGMIVRKMGALQKEMMKAKDVRVKVVNEVLQGWITQTGSFFFFFLDLDIKKS